MYLHTVTHWDFAAHSLSHNVLSSHPATFSYSATSPYSNTFSHSVTHSYPAALAEHTHSHPATVVLPRSVTPALAQLHSRAACNKYRVKLQSCTSRNPCTQFHSYSASPAHATALTHNVMLSIDTATSCNAAHICIQGNLLNAAPTDQATWSHNEKHSVTSLHSRCYPCTPTQRDTRSSSCTAFYYRATLQSYTARHCWLYSVALALRNTRSSNYPISQRDTIA
jgi:hypothetical protein